MAAGDELERQRARRRPGTCSLEPRGDLVDVDAFDLLIAGHSAALPGAGRPSDRSPSTCRPPSGPRRPCPVRCNRVGHPYRGCPWLSTSPTPPSRPRCSSAPSRRPSWSTCGRRGAVRAARSARSSSRWSTRPRARSCWPRSTSTRTRQSRRPFQVQSIPAVYALKDGKVVDRFIGAQPEAGGAGVRRVACCPASRRTRWPTCSAEGDEASLRQALELEPDNEPAIVALAELLVDRRPSATKRCELLARIPESADTRRVAALARAGRRRHRRRSNGSLDALLDRVEGRRRRPPGVPRPARAARPRRPAHRRLPQAAHRPPVLTVLGPRGLSPRAARA